MKLRINETVLNEDIAAVKKYYPNIPDDTFMELIALDPTYTGKDSVGKYGKWLLNLFNRNKLPEDQFSEVTPLLNQFTTYRNRIQNKDLNSYKTLDDLADTLASVVDDDSMLTPRQKTKFLKNVKSGKIKVDKSEDYDIVLDTPNFIVYIPNTHEASMKLGKGTEWCTAHEDPKWYNNYTVNGGKLYIIKNKETGERWQYSDKSRDFLDQDDADFDIVNLMRQDVQLSKFFAKFLGMDYFNFDGTWIYNGQRIPKNVKKDIKKVIITDNVTSIEDYAFENCKGLTSISIPDSVESIGDNAFYNCSALISITIGNSVTSIGDGAFGNCTSLTSIIIPDSIESISDNAFRECYALTSVTIGNSVTSIAFGAFMYCYNLTSIVIPNSVTSIGAAAFNGCVALTSVTIGNSVTSIGEGAFHKCRTLTSVIIPDSVTSIGNYAFERCEALTSISIPNSVTSIGYYVFRYDNYLTVYTDNDYIINYCNEKDIKVRPLKSKTESYKSFKLRIREF